MTLQQIAKFSNIISGIIVILFIIFITILNIYPNISGSYFNIKNVEIFGINKSDRNKIKLLIESKDKSLLLLNLHDTAEEVKLFDWIKKINVKKKYPNTLIISVIENEPFAYFLNDQKIFLIDSDGEKIIKINNIEKLDDYLILSGKDGEIKLSHLIQNINIFYSDILSSIKEIEFIEKRRWNIILKNNLKIKLAENNIKESLLNLKKLINDEKILKSNVIEVDLRLLDRAIIKVDGEKLKLKLEEV